MDSDQLKSSQYPDVYYSGRDHSSGPAYRFDDEMNSLPREDPDFNFQGYDRRKKPKPISGHSNEAYDYAHGTGPPPRNYNGSSLERPHHDHHHVHGDTHDRSYPHKDYSRSKEKHKDSWENKKVRNPSSNGSSSADDHFDSIARNHRDKNHLLEKNSDYDKPTRFLFLVIGPMMMVIGIVKAALVLGNHFFSGIWTGFLVSVVGVLGLMHRAEYRAKGKNWAYITIGLVASLAVTISSFLHMVTLVPVLATPFPITSVSNISHHSDLGHIISMKMQTPVVFVKMDAVTQLYINLGLDLAMIILLCIGYYMLSAVARVASHFWDVNWETTGNCFPTPRKYPLFFNPFDQFPLGQTAIFLGFFSVCVSRSVQATYWSPVLAGGIAIISAGFNVVYEKRPDKKVYVMLALLLQILTCAACIAAMAFITMGLYGDVLVILSISTTNRDWYDWGKWVGSATAYALADASLLINVLYALGSCTRQVIKLFSEKDKRKAKDRSRTQREKNYMVESDQYYKDPTDRYFR